MPRRESKEQPVTSVDAATAAQTEPPAGEQPAAEEKAPKALPPEKPLGPMTTRTGADALVIKSPKGQRVFTAGGDKGAKIAELLKTKPGMPRKEIAALVGCSQSRVAEVARVLGMAKGREEQQAEAAAAATAESPAEAVPATAS